MPSSATPLQGCLRTRRSREGEGQEHSPSSISPAPLGYVKRAFRGGARSETLNPDPVTELPLTPPAEDDEEEAAISPRPSLEEQNAELEGAPWGFPGRKASDYAQI